VYVCRQHKCVLFLGWEAYNEPRAAAAALINYII
jgi:hypothetical protein